MKISLRTLCSSTVIALLLAASRGDAQSLPGWGRVSLFGMTQTVKNDDGTSRSFSEVTGAITIRSKTADDGGLEYAVDGRGSLYPGTEGRSSQASLNEAWVGGRTKGGALTFRLGQMYLAELGGLGSVGGLMAEYKLPGTTPLGKLRFGLFGGLEPKIWAIGFAPDVKKGGVWAAVDGEFNRRDVLGYVTIKNGSLTERSVLTTTNFIPIGKQFFMYQAAEYDLTGPGGLGSGGLNYFFVNARYSPTSAVELMATYHRGRSIDTRSITDEIKNGRPVDQKSLDGFLYESMGGRVQVEVVKNVRLYGGYYNDRNNYEDARTGRVNAGLWATNILGSGFDFTLSDNRILKTGGGFDAWWASLGHNIGPNVYLSLDYSTSLSTISLTDSGGITVTTQPRTKRYSMSGNWNIDRRFSLFFTAEQFRDDTSKDLRVMLGLNYRVF
jgi:hypothetical protein